MLFLRLAFIEQHLARACAGKIISLGRGSILAARMYIEQTIFDAEPGLQCIKYVWHEEHLGWRVEYVECKRFRWDYVTLSEHEGEIFLGAGRLIRRAVVPENLIYFERAPFVKLLEAMEDSYDHSCPIHRYIFDDNIARELCSYMG